MSEENINVSVDNSEIITKVERMGIIFQISKNSNNNAIKELRDLRRTLDYSSIASFLNMDYEMYNVSNQLKTDLIKRLDELKNDRHNLKMLYTIMRNALKKGYFDFKDEFVDLIKLIGKKDLLIRNEFIELYNKEAYKLQRITYIPKSYDDNDLDYYNEKINDNIKKLDLQPK